MTDDQMPARHDRSEVSAEPMTLRELADVIERAFRPIAEAVRQAVGNGPSVHTDGPERPAEGTGQGEGQGGAEGTAEWDRLTELNVAPLNADAVGFLTVGPYGTCPRCGDQNSQDGICLTCTHPDHPSSAVHWQGLYELAVTERDGLRGKVEAVRALCDAAERDEPDAVFSQGGPMWAIWTDDVRKALDGGEG